MAGEPNGLIGHWDFDDGTGTDLSGNGNHAMLGGTKIYSLGEGRACIEMMPDTEPMRIPVPQHSPLAMSRGTICFWLNTAWGKPNILNYETGQLNLTTIAAVFRSASKAKTISAIGTEYLITTGHSTTCANGRFIRI